MPLLHLVTKFRVCRELPLRDLQLEQAGGGDLVRDPLEILVRRINPCEGYV
jgi:hypothetical protein